ncbi:hypothetical protein [Nocardioides sp. JQ2195]|uniref:hypothetical protein n=1 Tax=Nocardioides sp. JQ2195 TaxID=2592334 RepID=UPI001F0F2209|nr:hypothetical protein [Nocardioides sp. JQ2195]
MSPVLTGNSLTVTSAVKARARAGADEQAALQREYAEADATIEPESVVAPDLTSPRAKAAAERAGIDLDRWIARH